VQRIQEHNFVLLEKWCWRLNLEKDNLWYKVLAARYGTNCFSGISLHSIW